MVCHHAPDAERRGALVQRFMQNSEVVERAWFQPAADGRQLFCVLHQPSGVAELGVVVCSPVHAEMAKNYGREVFLARAAAERGIPVLRFHYRGAGNSSGGGERSDTITTMVEDATCAAAALRARCDMRRVAVVGTRVGALVAASLAAELPGSPLAVWEPVLTPKSYFRELYRATVISGLKSGTTLAGSVDGFLRQLRSQRVVDVLGYPISQEFYESVVQAAELPHSTCVGPAPKFLGQISPSGQLRPEVRALSHSWAEQGCDVTTEVVAADEAWWFGGGGGSPATTRRATLPLVEATAAWLTRVAVDAS